MNLSRSISVLAAPARRRMRAVLSIAALLAGLGVALPATANAEVQRVFYVAPTGSDAVTNAANDAAHPFATLTRARDAVRAINTATTPMTGDIVVNVAPGDYYVTSPMPFDNRDSGTGGYHVIYQVSDPAQRGAARFIGGDAVPSAAWSAVTRTGADVDLPASALGHVYKANVGTAVDFNTLYVDGVRATMARTPNRVVDSRFPAANGKYFNATGGSVTSLNYSATDVAGDTLTGLLNAQSRGQLDAQVYEWNLGKSWMTDTVPIGSVDSATHTVNFKAVSGHPELNRARYPVAGGSRYFLQNNLGFLDAPGEFYFNKTTGYVYYYPLPGQEDLSSHNVVIPVVQKIVDVVGSSHSSMVSNITLDGLTFMDTNFPDYYSYGWSYADNPGGMGTYPLEARASGVTLPSYSEQTERTEFQVGVITLSNTSHITIANTHVTNAGMFGIELYLANDHTLISNSLIDDTGHGGVNIEGGYPGTGGDSSGNGYSNNTTVDNCLIHDIGQLVGQTSGVTINNASFNTVSHSEIYNSPRRALFISGGYQRNTTATTTPNDLSYNPMRDLYAHDNTFSYDYLHDAEQDGGDDGALFSYLLYPGSTQYRVNTIDQLLIDRVGAEPSMTDFAPNGMNLDIGASGFVVNNLKAVNPQNFNTEVSTIAQLKDHITFNNTNADFGSLTNQLAEFDDSRMDYANIGVDAGFPATYRPATAVQQTLTNIYFQDAFEHGLDMTKWAYRGVKPLISPQFMSEGVRNGKAALEIDDDGTDVGRHPVLYRDFGQPLNKVVTLQFFDRQSSHLASYTSGVTRPTTARSIARADDGATAVGLGLDSSVSNTYYVVQSGATVAATTVPRSYGWHELKWDYTSGTNVRLSIDGTVVQTLTTPTAFRQIELGSDNGTGVNFYDQVYVSGGSTSGTAPALTAPIANLAESATITATSQVSSVYSRLAVADGVTGLTGRGEWASTEQAPAITLDWPSPKAVSSVVLYDRHNLTDRVKAGTLTFSDGSSINVAALPNDGSPATITFPAKVTTLVRLQVTSGSGQGVGLSEFEVWPTQATFNDAASAAASASSQYSATYSPDKVTDTITGRTGSGEWAPANTDATPWIQLTWPAGHTTNKVVLFDRANSTDQVKGGTLAFSDGSSISVPALPNDGSAYVVPFPNKTISWAKFTVTSYSGLPGLSELQAFEPDPNLSVTATATASSSYDGRYLPALVGDNVVGKTGAGEWAVTGSDSSPWIKLAWPATQAINKIVLYDRANSVDRVTSGALTFSDGTSVNVAALPNDGSGAVITFAKKFVTWVTFRITASTGLPGLAEFQTSYVPNLATEAATSASSTYDSRFTAARLIDGLTGQTGAGEWAPTNSDASPWARLDWPNVQAANGVALYDRPNATDQVLTGTLVFSDGSTIPVSALPNDGTPNVINFPTKYVSWVRFDITSHSGLAGLSELQAFAELPPNLARSATATASSQYSAQYPATAVLDGITGKTDTGEWAIASSDTNRWLQLSWAATTTISQIVLYDRANLSDRVTGGTLTFSDGSSVPVPALNNDGTATIVSLPSPKVTSSVKFTITSSTGLPGLAEFQVY